MTPIFVEKLCFPRCQGGTGTLPETDMFAEAWWLESMKFGRWMALFSAANFFWVSGRLKEEILPSRDHISLIWKAPTNLPESASAAATGLEDLSKYPQIAAHIDKAVFPGDGDGWPDLEGGDVFTGKHMVTRVLQRFFVVGLEVIKKVGFLDVFSNKTMLSDRKKVWLVYQIYIITITKQYMLSI